jgi:hypothetical protein
MRTCSKTISVVLAIVAAAVAAGCATQTAYQPAAERGAYGYTDTQLTERRHRIAFTGNSLTDKETVQDYMLLRAAEVTLENGYDWFRPVTRETERKSRDGGGSSIGMSHGHPHVYRRCGLLSCDSVTTYDTRISGSVSSGGTRDSYASSIEILMGKDPMPDDTETYNAEELASNLRRWLNTGGR